MEDADAGGTQRLVTGPRIEVGVERADVDRQLGDALRAVDEGNRPRGSHARHHLRDRVDGPEHVGDVGEGRQPDATAGELVVQLSQGELAVVGDVEIAQLGARLLAQQLPGDDVGVVLHLRDQHHVAGAHVLAPPRVRDQVDGLGRVAGEDRCGRLGAGEGRDPRASTLEQVGGLLGEPVDAAVDVGVAAAVVVVHRLDHRGGLLGGGGRVEVDERTTVDLTRHEREVGPDVEEAGGRGGHHFAAA